MQQMASTSHGRVRVTGSAVPAAAEEVIDI
jgi:hypothetical protein